jgi:hypothetical protein
MSLAYRITLWHEWHGCSIANTIHNVQKINSINDIYVAVRDVGKNAPFGNKGNIEQQ